MNSQVKGVLSVLGVCLLLVLAHRAAGWAGVALAGGGVVMWFLLHFNRTMQALKRAAERPIGFVDSAVMLNAKLKRGQTLLHVVALTRALGQPLSPKNQQPEIFRWTDGGDSSVTCTFDSGRLREWQLERPQPPA